LTTREISTIVRYGPRPTIVLITNRGQTIEAEIHHSLYNRIKNWDHNGLLAISNTSEVKGFGPRAATVEEPAKVGGRAPGRGRVLLDRGPF
jgi:TPP-dependent 2-oxoacid decarboxylase